MATRMQQRRGTAAQWTAANPVLAAGEIGFETDTSRFKMGNGSSAWSSLTYFANTAELTALLDGAPDALNTLNELAAAIGDDADFIGTFTSHTSDTTNVHGIADTAALATTSAVNAAIAVAASTVNASILDAIDGAAFDATTKASAAQTGAELTASTALSAHASDTTDVHGIADTTLLATKAYADAQAADAQAAAEADATSKVSAHDLDTTDVHGIADTSLLATKEYADGQAADALADATTLANNAKTEAITAAGTAADEKVAAHNLDTTNVHGIADTADLVTQADLTNAINGAEVDQSLLAGNGLSWNSVATQFEVDETHITTATQSALDLKAPLANPTFTGTVSGVTKSHVGLGNVDNTSDSNKPVSTATQTALDAKASLAGATFTGDVTVETNLTVDGNLTVTGTTTTVNATDLVVSDPLIYLGEGNSGNLADLGFVANFNDGTYQHAGLVRDSSAGTWKLFKGVTDEPTTTVNFAQGSLDALAVGALTATTVTPSSGIVFSDGTQTKVGVPSVTTFATAISSSATLASGEQDKFVPLTGAVTITLPATGYSTGQSIDFYQASGTGAQFASTNSVVGTPGLKFRTTNSVVTAMKTASGWLVFGDLSA